MDGSLTTLRNDVSFGLSIICFSISNGLLSCAESCECLEDMNVDLVKALLPSSGPSLLKRRGTAFFLFADFFPLVPFGTAPLDQNALMVA